MSARSRTRLFGPSTWIAVVAVLALLFAHPTPALARKRFGNPSTAGGGGRSYGRVPAFPCVDRGPHVVGFRRCTRFGDEWADGSAPALSFGLDVVALRLDPSALAVDGVGPTTSQPWSYASGPEPWTTGIAPRGQLALERYFYVAIEGAFAMGPGASGSTLSGGSTLAMGQVLLFAFGASGAVGVQFVEGVIGLRAEVLGGVLWQGIIAEVRDVGGLRQHASFEPRARVEPRLRIDLWPTPWVSVGLVGGLDVLGPVGDAFVGVSVGVHARSYDTALP